MYLVNGKYREWARTTAERATHTSIAMPAGLGIDISETQLVTAVGQKGCPLQQPYTVVLHYYIPYSHVNVQTIAIQKHKNCNEMQLKSLSS